MGKSVIKVIEVEELMGLKDSREINVGGGVGVGVGMGGICNKIKVMEMGL